MGNPALSRSRLFLCGATAADLMMTNPVSIEEDASLREAVILLTDKGYSAVPVIDAAGRPVGVLSRYDVLVHDREHVDYLAKHPDFYQRADLRTKEGESLQGFQVERVDETKVGDVMTPAVFGVAPDTPASQVISEMLALRIHRLFVVDEDKILVGVISALDILKHMREDRED